MERNYDLEVTCKQQRFGYWNLCKCLPNFVNVAALAGSLRRHLSTRPIGLVFKHLPQDPANVNA